MPKPTTFLNPESQLSSSSSHSARNMTSSTTENNNIVDIAMLGVLCTLWLQNKQLLQDLLTACVKSNIFSIPPPPPPSIPVSSTNNTNNSQVNLNTSSSAMLSTPSSLASWLKSGTGTSNSSSAYSSNMYGHSQYMDNSQQSASFNHNKVKTPGANMNRSQYTENSLNYVIKRIQHILTVSAAVRWLRSLEKPWYV